MKFTYISVFLITNLWLDVFINLHFKSTKSILKKKNIIGPRAVRDRDVKCEKKNYSCFFFCSMHSSWVFLFKLKILVFLEKISQIANLKVEHCCFFAFGCLFEPLQFMLLIFQISISFSKKLEKNIQNFWHFLEKSPWTKHKIFEFKKK